MRAPASPLLLLILAGCGGDRGAGEHAAADTAAEAEAVTRPAARPDTLTDTVRIEGIPQSVGLRLFRAPASFPLPFTAYVPDDLDASVDESTVHFTAAFGGHREPDAFLHLFVFPPGTEREVAVATARGYKTGRGIPVSQALEPLAGPAPPDLAWAFREYRFRYQSEGTWFVGTLGVGEHGGRLYQIVRHFPAEYGDGFGPRADLVLETWRWADGSLLRDGVRAPGASTSGEGPGP